ncbi:hypothetical protein BDZ89DRAFT_1132632 [Hymenopellis radicata]|nr:hypothetical protein BDZ89DRAFT_1132632 [Hymenopellis radicata]
MYDTANKHILIAVKKHLFISPFVTVLYQVSTQRPHDFILICNIRTHSTHVPRFIDPVSSRVLDWTDPERSAVQVPTEGGELEEMFNAIHLFGPYMVIFKTRSIELHPPPAQFQLFYRSKDNDSADFVLLFNASHTVIPRHHQGQPDAKAATRSTRKLSTDDKSGNHPSNVFVLAFLTGQIVDEFVNPMMRDAFKRKAAGQLEKASAAGDLLSSLVVGTDDEKAIQDPL